MASYQLGDYRITSEGNGAMLTVTRLDDGEERFFQDEDAATLDDEIELALELSVEDATRSINDLIGQYF